MNAAVRETIHFAAYPWCIDADTRDAVVARRNVLAGLWAGRLLGLADAALTAYAAVVHRADFQTEGDGDIVLKVAGDLSAAGLATGERARRGRATRRQSRRTAG